MAGKRKPIDQDPSLALLKFREKRRWQIALRRYVIEQSSSVAYAPYFALDIKRMRQWFEMQFEKEMNWGNFGVSWQFDHIIPVVYFDFSDNAELKMCWNFTNLRIEPIFQNKSRGNRVDVLAAKSYFQSLYQETGYPPCLNLLNKIDRIEISELLSTENQHSFIKQHRQYLEMIENYSSFEFELLNRGRSIQEVNTEIELLKKINK